MSIKRIVALDAERARVNINPTQYFDGVTPDLWSYQIGGYRVLSKWLEYRKGRLLTSTDTIHYSRIVMAFSKTILAQDKVDVVVTESRLFDTGELSLDQRLR
jgi:hypothetical protein